MKSTGSLTNAKLLFLVGLTVLSFVIGCGTGDKPTAPGVTPATTVATSAELFRSALVEYLDFIRENGITSGTDAELREATLGFLANRFGEESAEYQNAARTMAGFDLSDSRERRVPIISKHLQLVAGLADDALIKAGSRLEYVDRLRGLQADVIDGPGTDAERSTALSYLIVLEETTNQLAVLQGTDKFSWRCAASIVGGAILGGFTGAGGGSVIPVIGTGVGRAIGMLAGGAIGWASGC